MSLLARLCPRLEVVKESRQEGVTQEQLGQL